MNWPLFFLIVGACCILASGMFLHYTNRLLADAIEAEKRALEAYANSEESDRSATKSLEAAKTAWQEAISLNAHAAAAYKKAGELLSMAQSLASGGSSPTRN